TRHRKKVRAISTKQRRRIMENTNRTMENPTPPRDLRELIYIVKAGKEEDFFEYYKKTIIPYLTENGVEDAVVWTFELDNRTLVVIATSPTIPPWFGALGLERLEEFVEKPSSTLKLELENRRDLHIHWPKGPEEQCEEIKQTATAEQV